MGEKVRFRAEWRNSAWETGEIWEGVQNEVGQYGCKLRAFVVFYLKNGCVCCAI